MKLLFEIQGYKRHILTLQSPTHRSGQSGQAALIMVVFSLFISLALVLGLSAFAFSELQSARILERSKASFAFAEGALEDAMYRIASQKSTSPQITYQEGTLSVVTSVDVILDGVVITTEGAEANVYRTLQTTLLAGDGAAFNYGIQIGNGGFLMENTSSVQGSVYSNGPAIATNNNIIGGTVISSGAAGLIDGIHATGTAYAHTITRAQVDKDAYYQTISNTVVLGTEYPESNDLPVLAFPISDSLIDTWKDSVSSTVITSPCPYIIKNDATIGFVKIACNLTIRGNPTVTITGPIWVEGDITIENSPVIRIDPAIGNKSIAIIADNPSNHLTGSKITLQNSTTFDGSGSQNSYILLISQNNSSESGGDNVAISIRNYVEGELLLYARHGEVLLSNSVSLREVTAYKVHLKNSAEVIYEQGLANLLFESGPFGGWTIDTWYEIE